LICVSIDNTSMNFDKLANKINESLSAPQIKDEGRAPGARSAWLAANPGKTGAQYYAMLRKGGSAPATARASAPDTDLAGTGDSLQEPVGRGAAKTQVAIDDFIAANPDSSPEDVVAHLKSLNSGPVGIRTGYVTNPADVLRMISIAKGEEGISVPMEPTVGDFDSEKKAKFAKLRKFMMMPRAARDDYLSRKSGAADAIEKDPDTDEDEFEIDPRISSYVGAMKRKAYDDTDDEPEQVEKN
jgi:hypothetical protein